MVEVEIVGGARDGEVLAVTEEIAARNELELPVSHGSGDSGVWEKVLYQRAGVASSGRPRFVADR